MIKYVPVNTIEDDDTFPYDFTNWNYSEKLLRSTLYAVWWADEIPDNNDEERTLLMDYDGFIEWYNRNEPTWAEAEDIADDERMTAEEYLPYHIGRTIAVVKELKA